MSVFPSIINLEETHITYRKERPTLPEVHDGPYFGALQTTLIKFLQCLGWARLTVDHNEMITVDQYFE